ncbi:MAG TPA: peroxiredoxin [Steroidobacteraceae bacterium]|nr:peroxiredoxin [Steroidobacteraceae bacterium]
MRAGAIRISPLVILAAFAALALAAVSAMAAGPAAAPAAGTTAKPKAGDTAPAFSLVDQNGKKHSLSDYKGKWVVVYFYPKDQTPGCTTQACQFTENVFAFRKAGAQILGISVDDEASHKAFEKALAGNAKISAENQKLIEEHGLPFPLLADSTFATAKAYGVLTQRGTMNIASRETFLIDPQGKVARHYEVTPDKLEGHSAELLKDIKALQEKKN